MKTFWKVFIVSFIFFIIAISLGSYSYLKANEEKSDSSIDDSIVRKQYKDNEREELKKVYHSLSEAYDKSDRINIIILGMEDIRTDTIIFASFEPDTKKINVISVPRDTYIHRKGYSRAEQRKINAIYGEHGVEGVRKAVSHIFQGVPIHHYIMLDYKGVEKVVDSIGGVEVVVPFHMKYDDPTADPPLHIDLKKGKRVLNGKKALEFLRYRTGNSEENGYIDGDLGRIKAQQQFLKSFTDKVLSYRLPMVIKDGYQYVETDITLIDALNYSRKALGMKSEDISFSTLPGESKFRRYDGKLLSYYIFDSVEIKNILEETYNIEKTPND
ncbi:LCP family protein [Schnuerera sp. xch1]|uniref:LCP family protein n=1 Tax=Schnuerera sp. xch1 TaxID=2874283 RepID=UPI001CBAE734|nr:LCP family protein [Schnuerera sp. xch1]MBZ2174600.1 LCP family protein [Schnuerera sp. xch1]